MEQYKLCTAEKPSVAKDIARVIGADKRENGYFIGNGYIVTWAVGHLISLAEPEEYGYVSRDEMWDKERPEMKQKAAKELPLFPQEFILVVKEDVKAQYKVMSSLFHREDVGLVIDCGDMGPEGHILQWLIRQKAGCTKPVKRFCATSMTDEAIREAFSKLRPIEEFKNIIQGEFCKKKADWIMGISLSRAASIKYNARVDVGRVQSPTLFFVVKRFLENKNFQEKKYFTLKITLKEGFSVFWQKDKENIIPDVAKDEEGRIIDRQMAEKMSNRIMASAEGVITSFETKQKAEERPQLYDITELQRDGNRIYGYSADETLNIAQALYEKHKIMTYPRTDSRYITSDLVSYMPGRIRMLLHIPEYKEEAEKLLEKGLNIDKRIVDDSKVTDHHALIVTEGIQGFNLSLLSAKEKNILDLVITRMLVAFSEKYVYEESTVAVKFAEYIFTAKGKRPLREGWKQTQKNLKKQEQENTEDSTGQETIFPPLQENQKLQILKCEIENKNTTAPKLHTEATLLTAMENAGAKIENGAILKGKGIGTQATRAAIIKSLFDKNYIKNEKQGKTNYLIPTKQGINVIKVLPKELYSPSITADWETKISKIAAEEMKPEEFMDSFRIFMDRMMEELNSVTVSDADFSPEKISLGSCPWCHKPVYSSQGKKKGTEYFFCSEKCGFFLASDNMIYTARTGGKKLTESQIKKLLADGEIKVKCISKTGKEYPAVFRLIKNEKGYAAFDISLSKNNEK